MPTLPRRSVKGFLLFWLVVIAVLTLTPRAANTAHDPSWCFRCAHVGARDVILNVLLFVPLGASLALLGWRHWWCGGAALVISLLVETGQWLFLPGRQASLVDVSTNTIGGFVGAATVLLAGDLLRPSRTRARWLVLAIGTTWVAQLVVTAWALDASLTPDRIYWGQWAHVFRATEPFPGRVTRFSINGTPIPDDSIADHGTLRSSMLAHGITIDAGAVEQARVPTRAQIVGLADDSGNLLVGITQEQCGNRLIVRMRGDAVGLAAPTVRVPRTCEPGSSTAFRGYADRRGLTLVAERGAVTTSVYQPLRATLGWALLSPSQRLMRWAGVFSFLWVLVFAVPMAWMVGHAGLPRWGALLGYVLVVPGGIVAVTMMSRLANPGIGEWLACLLAAAATYFGWAAWNAEIRAAR